MTQAVLALGIRNSVSVSSCTFTSHSLAQENLELNAIARRLGSMQGTPDVIWGKIAINVFPSLAAPCREVQWYIFLRTWACQRPCKLLQCTAAAAAAASRNRSVGPVYFFQGSLLRNNAPWKKKNKQKQRTKRVHRESTKGHIFV